MASTAADQLAAADGPFAASTSSSRRRFEDVVEHGEAAAAAEFDRQQRQHVNGVHTGYVSWR